MRITGLISGIFLLLILTPFNSGLKSKKSGFQPKIEYIAQASGTNGSKTGSVTRTLGGFAGISWKSSFSAVKQHLKNLVRSSDAGEKVAIVSEVRNRYILVKRNDVLYRYNFYKTPLVIERILNHQMTKAEHEVKEAFLFHVKVTSVLIEASRIQQKLQKLYGRHTKSTVNKKNAGANIWELEGGLLFQWNEPYKKTAFTRNIDYISLEMSKQILKEYEQYFDAKERYILKKMLLK